VLVLLGNHISCICWK